MSENKERIAELKKQRKAMNKELDELKGKTAKGKAMSVLLFFLIMGILLGGLVVMVKLDVGGVAEQVLAPVIGDVPKIRSILPQRLQRKNASEIAAEKKAAADQAAAKKAQDQAAAQAAKEAQASASAQASIQAQATAQAQQEAAAQASATAAAQRQPV